MPATYSASAAPSPATTKSTLATVLWKFFFWMIVILGVTFFAAYLSVRTAQSNKVGFNLTRPIAVAICSGEFVVQAGQTRYWTVNVTASMVNAHLVGSFQAVGGAGNDIQAVVADQVEFQNWVNGHPARVLYSTQKVTAGRMDVPLSAGTYVVAFSNGFSLLSNKQVSANIVLQYL